MMRSVVTCADPLAADAAIEVFDKGGNVVDAAVSCIFAQGVVNPYMGGLGGFGSMYYSDASTKKREVIQFNSAVGSKASPTMWADDFVQQEVVTGHYKVKGDPNVRGYRAACTPGTPMGLHEAHKRFGSLPWEELVEPAIRYARYGFKVPPYSRRIFDNDPPILNVSPEAARIFAKNGRPVAAGETLVQDDLANTLERIATEGVDVFYHGDIAQAIASDMEKNDGFITLEDLDNYSIRAKPPISVTYRGHEVTTDGPPSGGFQIIQMLKMLEAYDLAGMGHNTPEYINLVCRALQLSFTDRAKYLTDPDFHPVPMDWLLSDEHIAECRQIIDSGKKIEVPLVMRESGTTHISLIDQWGNAVVSTHTNGSTCGVITPRLGFLYNNAMSQLNPLPNDKNSIIPGKRRTCGLCPTIVYKNGKPLMLSGSAGGNLIQSSTLQSIINVIDHNMNIAEAVCAPRFHCEKDAIYLEATVPNKVRQRLADMGQLVERGVHSFDGKTIGRVQAIWVDPDTQEVKGCSDPRSGGGCMWTKS